MTTTGPADVVMAACSHAVADPLVPARPGFCELVSVWPASGEPTVVRAVFPGSVSFKPAVDRMTGPSRTRQPDPRQIDGVQLFREAECSQTLPGGAERVGLQDLGARLRVFLMDLANHVGRREVQLIEAAIDEHAARVKHGTHRAIGHDHAARQLVTEFLGTGTDRCSHE